MLRMEAYKVFKRKLVWVSLLGIFLLVFYSGVSYLGTWLGDESQHEGLQEQIAAYEKHKGTLTDRRITEFMEDYTLGEYDYMQDFFQDGVQLPVSELYPGIDFDIRFGYFEFWVWTLSADLPIHMKYIPIFIVIAFSALFTYENECGMTEILLSTREGRQRCTNAKVAVAFLATNAVYIIVWLFTLVPLALAGGAGWDTSIQMTPWLRDSQLDMNYLTLLLHAVFLSFLAVNVILLITLCSSVLAKKPMAAMCISLGVLFFWQPDIMSTYLDNTAVNRITSITPLNITDVINLAEQAPVAIGGAKMHWLFLAEILYSVLLVAGGIFFFTVLTKNQKYYAA